jgi:hypothetical protein
MQDRFTGKVWVRSGDRVEIVLEHRMYRNRFVYTAEKGKLVQFDPLSTSKVIVNGRTVWEKS